MNKLLLFLLATFVCANAYAMDTYRFDSRLVEVGDTVSKLIEVAGSPLYKEPIETDQGGAKGERWQYRVDNGAVTFVIRDGKIRTIEQTRD
jgi:hypothetical protein